MNAISAPRVLRLRWPWAIAAGVMFAIAQPKFELAGFAWIAPAVLLIATLGATPKQTFWTAYFTGIVQQLITIHWLLFIPLTIPAIVGWLALSAYLAIFPALWCLLAWKLFPLRLRGDLFDPTPTDHFTETNAAQRLVWALLCACGWVAVEMTQARLLTGFPWNFLGVSQFRMLPLIQICSVTGVYGVSFVMAWFACSVFSAGMILTRQTHGRAWLLELIPPLTVIFGLLMFGLAQIRATPRAERTVKVALIQPSIPQTLIWDPNENTNRFNELVKLSEMALRTKPQILIWPEAAMPTMLRWDTNTWDKVSNLVTNHHVWAIVGSDDLELGNAPPGKDPEVTFYNSAFAVSPDGVLLTGYRKRRLVIFGEWIPFYKYLPFLKYLSPAGENPFSPGAGPVPFKIPDLDVTTSVLICFEDTFPHLAREYVNEDTDFLLNLTNNGWFGESAAQWQHAATAIFRAVENRIPLVRCANNGLTCWVDQSGGLHEVYQGNSRDIYSAGFKTAHIPLLAKNEKRALTFYTKRGDVFGWLCVGFALAGYSFRSRRNCHAASSEMS
ncbi:MAG TPA: apolipoprotein N-acyltransferase [Verrucomicrobiae bacterium]